MSATDANHEPERKRRLFADVSAVQVVATAAAAVTSMLLSSYIGIAGSIIGVAVASVVSTLAASLYKKFLADSAEKIKELPVVAHPSSALAHVLPGHHGSAADEGAEASEGGEDGKDGEVPEGQHRTEGDANGRHDPATSAAPTEPLAIGAESLNRPGSSLPSAGNATAPLGHPGARAAAADAKLDPVAALHRQRKLVRGLIVVCIASALLAVAASGAVVYFATMGAGLGQKPAPIYLSAPFTPIGDEDDGSGAASAGSSAAASDSSAASSSDDAASDNTTGEDGTGGGDDGTGGDGSGSSGNTTDPTDPGGDSGSDNTTPGGTPDGGDKPSPGTQPSF